MTVSSSDAQRGEIDEDATSGAVTLEVTLSESSTEAVTVAYATADFASTDTAVSSSSIDPATAGADYTAASGTLTFAAGETRKTITVSISDDVNRERDELFKVGLSSATGGATIASTGSEATILIDDDDPFPKATITASVPGLTSTGAPGATDTTPEGFLSVDEGDSGNTDITFTVTLEGTDYFRTSFSVKSIDGSATGNEDYRRVSFVSVDIAAGQTTGTVTLSVVGDENYEPDETLSLEFLHRNLDTITNSADTRFRVEVTITNDDAVMATSASNLQARPAGSGNLAVSWDPAFGAPNGYSVRWRKASESDTALSAVNTVTATSYTITGLDNDTSYHVRLDTRNLANDGIASNTSLTTNATPTAGAAPTVTAIANQSARVGQPFEVDVDATPGTAGDSLQYQAASSAPAVATVTPTALTAHDANSQVTVTPVAAGTATITVTVSDGTEVDTETFAVTVSQPSLSITPVAGNGVTVSSSDAQRGEIDEDAASGAVTLEVTLSESSTEAVTVAYATADFSSTDTAVSSSSIDPATAGADYTAASGTLTFAAGETRKTITVSISDDVNRERDELFKVGLSSATGGATIASTGSEATILIDDDDPFPKATITASVPGLTSTGAPGATDTTPEGFLSVDEGDSGNTDITFTVTLEGTDYFRTSFSVKSIDGSATGNEDYRRVSFVSVDIAAGQTTGTVTLSVVGDENYEPDETLSLEFLHRNLDTITNSADTRFRVEVTITNDDAVMATSASNLQARPAGSGNLAVSWDPAFGAPNGYSVRWRKASESDTALSAVNTVTATSYTITGLDNDTSYHVRLDTRNLANDGIASGTSLTTAATPTSGAAPTVTAIANQSARVGQPFEVDVDATPGTAGDSLQYQAASSAPAVATVTPTALTAHSASSKVTVTPVAAGTATITVTVSDGTEVGTETFDVTVSQVTLSYSAVPPTLTVDTPITALTATAAGFGSAMVTYAVTTGTLPAGLNISATTGAITGTPTAANTTTTTVTVTATTGTGMDTQTATADITFPAVGKGTLATPTNLAVKANSNMRTGFTVTWDAVSNAAGYTATAVQGSNSFTGAVSTSGTTPEAAFTGLTANTTYTVTVTATGDANYSMSEASDEFDVTTAANQVPTVGTAIPDQTATVDTAFEYSFPAGTFSDADSDSLTYTAAKSDDSALPTWLTFTASERKLAGTPQSGDIGTLSVKVTASDGMGGSVSDTFDIVVSVADTAPAFAGGTTIADKTFTVDAEITAFTLPEATGGNGTISYALTPGLPTGLSVDTSTREVSGTPTAAATAATYTWRASDSDSNTANSDSSALTFMLTVNKATLATPVVTVSAQDGKLTASWADVTNAASYEVEYKQSTSDTWLNNDDDTSPAEIDSLTNGTEYDVRVRAKVASASTNYEDSPWSEVKKGTPVEADVAPSFGSETVAAQTWTVGTEVDVTLPAATGGNGTVSYALTPALPNGVNLDATTRKVSGTPTAVASTATYTWQASDSDSNTANTDTAALTFSVTVGKGTLATPANLALKAGSRSKTGFTVTWTAVTNATGYTATATPSGGTAVAGTVSIPSSGPEAAFTGLTAGTTYTVSVVATGNTANYEASTAATLSQATAANSAPTVANAIPDQTATTGTAFSFTLPAGTFSDADSGDSLTYTAQQTDGTTDSALPTWLTFTAGTGVFSGTPTSTDAGTLSVKVTANDGTDSVSDTFDIVVSAADTAPAFASSATIADKTFTVDAEITAFTLPEATGGNGTISYALTPDLPTGLSLNESTREVSGTPTAAVTATTYTWRASDGDSNTANSDSSALTFMLTVNKATLATPMVTVSAQDGKLTASWAGVTNAASYEVEYKQSTSDTWLNNDDDTSPAEIDSLTNGTEYDVRVRAKAASASTNYEDSPWSDVKKGTPVEADVVPSFGSETIAAQTWTVGTEVDVTLPVATGGNGTVSYALTPALPNGVSLDVTTRKVSGTPTAVASAATYTWRASDSDSNTANTDTVTLTFSVTVGKGTLTTPSNLALKANTQSKTGFTVTWDAVSNATGYTATATPSGGSAVTGTVDTTGTNPEAVFTGLTAGTTYTVSVVATGNTANYEASTAATLSQATAANSAPTVANAIPDQTATVDMVFEYSFPVGTFSDADSDSLTYTAQQTDGTTDSALPTWLTFTASERKLAGTPQSGNTGTLMVKVTASDGMGGSVSDTFNIVVSVADTAPAFASSATIADKTFTVDTEITAFTLPAATGGNGTIGYALTPDLPTGLSLSESTREVRGTPTAAASAATYTWRASDSDSNTANSDSSTLTFMLTVNKATLATPVVTVSAQDGKLTTSWADVTNAASYEVEYKQSTSDTWLNNDDDTSPAEIDSLANGTEYDVRVRAKAASSSTNYEDSAWSDVKKGTPVEADVVPSFGSETIAAQTWTVGTEVDVTLPAATGGNGTVSYALTPALPGGVSLDATTRKVSGTPTAAATATTYTWRASDSDSNTANSDTAALTFMLTVNKATLATPSNLGLKANTQSKTGFTVSWTAVTNATGYTATATPSGGTAVAGTVSIPSSGPEAAFTSLTAGTTYTVSVVATGNTANYEASTAATLSQATAANSAPTVANAIPDQAATTGTAFSFTLPAGTFNDADSGDSLTYTAQQTDGTTDSALPTWLSFTAGTGVFSGTPTSTDIGTLSVKVTASDGTASVSDTFDIVVSATATAPAFASSATIADKTFTVDAEITAFTLPEATGGNGTISYALTPDLPTGLSLNESTREVSGRPTAVASAATYTWRASDSDGNMANTDTAALTFQVTVVDAVPVMTPTQVSNLQVSAGDGSLEVSWTAASVAPNGYSVRWRERGPGNVLTPVNEVDGTSFTIPDLSNGQEYVVRVETRTAANDGVQVGTVVTTTGTPVGDESVVTPTQVSNLRVSAGDGSLEVSWTAASVAPNGYSVRWREKGPGNALTPVNEVDGTSFTIPDLINDQEYVVRVETRTVADDGIQVGTVVTATGVPVEDEVAPPPPPPPTPPAVGERGLPRVSIEDASAMEGDDLEFRVTLSKAVQHRVKVYWATRPGTARANRDYKSAAGAVVFRPGVMERRIRVETREDDHNDPDETMQVRLSSPRGVLIEDGIATGRINNWDALPVAWLARFGRAMTEQALEGIEQRLTAPREAGTRGTLAGITLAGLTTSNFTHTGVMDAAGGSLAFWGRGARADFHGRDGVVHLDGQTETATLGADYARDQWLTGVMLTSSRGTGGYQGVASGEVEVSLNAAIPYGSYRFSERLDVWGAVGRGTGALTLTPEGEGSIEADLDWSMMSAGLRGGLFGAAGHGPAVTLVSDVLWSRTGSGRVEAGEEHSSLASSEADTSRLRLGLEGSWAVTLGNVGAVTPKLEAGVRHDDGDAEQGFGVEVGGGLAWTLPAHGLTFDVSGRTLLTHEDDKQRAHGFSVALNFDPSAASTRGFTLNLRQDIGGPSSGGVQALFASELPGVGVGGDAVGTRWTLETAYGLAACDDKFTLSPSFGLAASDTSVDFHLGWQLMPELSEDALNLSLMFKITRRELLDVGTVNSIDSVGTPERGPEHGVHMEVIARW